MCLCFFTRKKEEEESTTTIKERQKRQKKKEKINKKKEEDSETRRLATVGRDDLYTYDHLFLTFFFCFYLSIHPHRCHRHHFL
jgi:hypothetical protein